MRASLITILGLLPIVTMAAESSVCPQDVEMLNSPGIVLAGSRVECDASPMPPGTLNECGMLKWAAQNSPAYLAIMREDKAFIADCRAGGGGAECDQGKFSPAFLLAQLKRSAVELSVLDNNPMGPPSVSIDTACILLRRGIPVGPKPKDATFLSERLSFSRSVADPKWSRAKSYEAPFLLSASDDRENEKSYVGFYGTIGYTFSDQPGYHAWMASAKIDSAAGSEAKDSSVTLGINWSKYFLNGSRSDPSESRSDASAKKPWIDSVFLRISPEYLTDRKFDRQAYQLSVVATPASRYLGNMGYMSCPGGCDVGNTSEFYWSTSMGLEAGRVDDAAGSKNLEAVAEQGAYVRLVPGISMTYKPVSLSPKISFQLEYAQRYDLTQGWDRGVGAFNVNYAIAPNAFWTLSWRKGRQESTFENIDTVLFGIGIRQ
jgi:hypothetical protein